MAVYPDLVKPQPRIIDRSTNNVVLIWQKKFRSILQTTNQDSSFYETVKKYWLGLAANIHKSMTLLWNNPSSYEYAWNHII